MSEPAVASKDKGLTSSSVYALVIIIVVGIFAVRCNGQKHCADSCDGSYTVTWPLADCECK